MSDKHAKKLKRKKKIEQRKAKALQTASYSYEGNKYRTPRLVTLMHAIENMVYILDRDSAATGSFELTDATIARVYRKLIDFFRAAKKISLRPDGQQQLAFDFSSHEKFVDSMQHNLKEVIIDLQVQRQFSIDEVVGVLRTLHSSLELWTNEIWGGRGYITYITDFLDDMDTGLPQTSVLSQDRQFEV